jgi:methionyl-tRNA formyltransferase
MNYLVVTIKSWNIDNFKKLQKNDSKNKWHIISEDLTLEKVKKINPRYIFFPHWSWIIPAEIYKNYECVVFHMTDLPYGRGGSPLQNLIVRGHKSTKVSAIKVEKELDAGPIYLKRDLELKGNAKHILQKLSDVTFEMIKEIVKNEPEPIPQKGKIVKFKRRQAKDGNIKKLKSLEEIYDYIRMLDAEGYPPAFLETKDLKFEFKDAELLDGEIISKVIITKNEKL